MISTGKWNKIKLMKSLQWMLMFPDSLEHLRGSQINMSNSIQRLSFIIHQIIHRNKSLQIWTEIVYKNFNSNFKALHLESWPSYLKINGCIPPDWRLWRSNSAKRLVTQLEKGIFQHSAAKLFNCLSFHIRKSFDFNYFCKKTSQQLIILFFNFPLNKTFNIYTPIYL